jgi:hypothetical protein
MPVLLNLFVKFVTVFLLFLVLFAPPQIAHAYPYGVVWRFIPVKPAASAAIVGRLPGGLRLTVLATFLFRSGKGPAVVSILRVLLKIRVSRVALFQLFVVF